MDASAGTVTFAVAYLPEAPRPPWAGPTRRTRGTLVVGPGYAEFTARPRRTGSEEPVVLEHVFRVARGCRASLHATWLPAPLDTYVEVIFGDPAEPSIAYFTDRRPLGLHPWFLQSDDLLVALRSLTKYP